MLNADGTTTDVQVLADNGNGTVQVIARDGNKKGGVTDGKQITLPKEQVQQGVNAFKRNQLRAESAQQTTVPTTTEDATPSETETQQVNNIASNANNLTSDAISSETATPSETTEQQATSAEDVPYEQMSAEDAWDRLVAETDGDVDMAREVAESMVEDKQKAVDKANKLKPKPGGTVAEKIANSKEVKAVKEQAQAELDAWKAIANVPNARMEQALAPEVAEVVEEVDENGHPFMTSSNGSTVFGEITDDTGLPNAPIKLSEGVVDENGNGYGLAHIEVRHGEQIRDAGFNSVEEFVEYVANNYDKDNIRVGKKRPNGSGTFIIQIEDKHSNLLYIELSRDGSYWNVNSGGIFRKGYAEKKKNVGSNTELSTSPTTKEDKSFVQTEDVGSVSADTHSDNQHLSTGKVTNLSEDNKGISQKVEEDYSHIPEKKLKEQISNLQAEIEQTKRELEDGNIGDTGRNYLLSELRKMEKSLARRQKALSQDARAKAVREFETAQTEAEKEDAMNKFRFASADRVATLNVPIPTHLIRAIEANDTETIEKWKQEFEQVVSKLSKLDINLIDGTIENVVNTRSKDKSSADYKGKTYIVDTLKKARKKLIPTLSESETAIIESLTRKPLKGRRFSLFSDTNAGLVEDARTKTLNEKTRTTLDEMAKRLGLQVEFVDDVNGGKANADIIGNRVRIAWAKRDQALDFLLGHEFTHRMQDLSPEAYAEFVEATKQALGEKEWNNRIEKMRNLYKTHGIAITEQGIIDEVVADYAGELVENRGVFDNFVNRNRDNRSLLSRIKDVLKEIAKFFSIGKKRKINNAIARLEALIESASDANVNTQKSLIEEAKLQIKQKMNDLQKAESTIKDWVENNKRGKSFEIILPTQTQRMVKRAMGKDYDSHNITANGIAHGFNNHGENGKKLGPNSIPVRKEDAGLIPYIMTAPDRVEKGSTDVRNRESVRFYKNLSNGYIVVVEKEQMNSSDDMETINIWIEMSSEATNAQQNVVPDTNVRNAILSTDVAKIRKDAETTIEKDVENTQKEKFSLRGSFYSNAKRAIEDIKQDKATPQQWIAMLKRNGGLKASEDKWLGLEDWLNEQQGSVTKQEITDYIDANSIKIEEVEYEDDAYTELQSMSEKLKNEYQNQISAGLSSQEAWDYMVEQYGDRITDAYDSFFDQPIDVDAALDLYFDIYGENLEDKSRAIHSTRLDYTTEGLENKREIALTVPTIEPYNQSDDIHFGDAGNGRAVAWIRFGETTDTEGNRVLVIDEIQSKRHQDGREKGYIPTREKQLALAEDAYNDAKNKYEEAVSRHSTLNKGLLSKYGIGFEGITDVELQELRTAYENQNLAQETLRIKKDKLVRVSNGERGKGVPSAPFEKNWHELAMKRMMRYAAENGFDKIAWTTGEQQAMRYDMSKVISHIKCDKVGKNGNKMYSMGGLDYKFVVDPNGVVVSSDNEFVGKYLSDIVGKPLANKMLEMQEDDYIEGDGLRIGGEGMKGFYDKMLPSFVNKYGKKWGAKVGEVTMPELENSYQTMHSVDVTEQMKEDVMKGQPLFSLRGDSLTEEQQRIIDEAKANGTYLKAPNGKASNLNEKQWVQVRTEAFKDWFGDWELAFLKDFLLNSNPVSSLTGNEFQRVEGKTLTDQVEEYFESIGGKAISPLYGEVILDRRGADDSLAHGMGRRKAIAYASVKDVIENGVLIDYDVNHKGRGYDSAVIAAPIEINGERFICNVVIHKNHVNNKFYLHEVTQQKNLLDEVFLANLAQKPTSSGDLAKVLQNIVTTKSKASKVIDENGEPLVVYHGTRENFTIFDRNKNNPVNEGFYFTNNKNLASKFAGPKGFVGEYFLDIKNPMFDGFDGSGATMRKSEYRDGGIFTKRKSDRYAEKGTKEIIVFDPTQIKSATDNVGTFDASNPDIRYSLFGGNSGYVGYSMSKRAARAREEGRFPKTDFRKEYSVTAKSFEELVDAKIIISGEWHHTSKFGNETKFYHWDEDYYADIYAENKKAIDKLSRERKTDEIVSLFENHPLVLKAEYDNETELLVDDVKREYNDKIREVENEKRDKERVYNSVVFDALGQLTNVVKANNGNLWYKASNGVGIQIDSTGNEVSMNYGGANGDKGALKYEARAELKSTIESVAKDNNIEPVDANYYKDRVNQLETERADRMAQLVEARKKEYTPKSRNSLRSDLARDEQMQGLLKDTPLWDEVAKSMPNAEDSEVAVL